MKRRTALKQLLMAAAVAAITPSCIFDKRKKQASVVLNHLPPVSGDQETTLATICDTIIPETDIPGAKSLASQLFVFKMVDDCYDKDTQDKFLKGLNDIDVYAEKRFGNAFSDLTFMQREELLKEIDKEEDGSSNLQTFFKLTKKHTIQGFMTSEYVMTKLQGYEFVPGRFNGCIEISKLKKS